MLYVGRFIFHDVAFIDLKDWLSSTPKHLVLYDAFGWEPPVFVHLPLLHAMSGQKLSKRDVTGSHLVEDYKADGILPEALLNFIALFGWSARTPYDVHSVEELISRVCWVPLRGLTSSFHLKV